MVATGLSAATGHRHGTSATAERPRVVIVGAGFGGLSAAKALRRCAAAVTVIDRRNYHLFQPLLYQVATAGLSPADIAAPIRGIVRDQANTEVQLGHVTGIDTAARRVIVEDRHIPYDFLILATGARHAYSDADWETFAPGLKKIEYATAIRAKILMSFERAEVSEDEAERRRLLTFVVVGGGPTGSSLPAPSPNSPNASWHGISAGSIPVPPGSRYCSRHRASWRSIPSACPEIARASLERLGVEVHTDALVERVDAAGAVLSGRRIEARTA